MGVVAKQSSKNVISLATGIFIGGINTMFLYVYFLKKEYYGLVTFLLSTAFLLMPLISLGVQYSIVKFSSGYKNKIEKDKFLTTSLFIPWIIILPLGILGYFNYETIANLLAKKNAIIAPYTYLIFLVAVATAYFEVFYAWAKVHLKSVFGNLLKEVFIRISATILLFSVYFEWIDKHEFIIYLTSIYFLQMLIMMSYALYLYTPKFTFQLPSNYKEVFKYSIYIILAGSAATILIDIDKFMIPQKLEAIEKVAYYSVAVYIGSVIEIPGRAMAQIIQPLTSKAINENNWREVQKLYRQSHSNLLVISGLLFVLINSNIETLYLLLPEKFSGGFWVVFTISIAKLYHMFLGNNGAIIANSNKYKILLPYGIAMALCVVTLNNLLIDQLGITGAALATLLVVLIFNTIKLIYVKRTFSISPFQGKTLYTLLIIISTTSIGIFTKGIWMHPLSTLVIKTLILSILYLFASYKLELSKEINIQIDKIIKKILRKDF